MVPVGELLSTEDFADKIFTLFKGNSKYISGWVKGYKWIKVAKLSNNSSFILNISKSHANGQPNHSLIYCAMQGNSTAKKLKQLAGAPDTRGVDKVRIASYSGEGIYLELHYNNESSNQVICSFSSYANGVTDKTEFKWDLIQFEEAGEPTSIVEELALSVM